VDRRTRARADSDVCYGKVRERDRDDSVLEALRRDAELDAHPERSISFEQLDMHIRRWLKAPEPV
jgi:hypothetical protein